MPLHRPLLFVAALGVYLHSVALPAQERAQDRRQWIAPPTVVSDDPRRIPSSGAPRGPEGRIALVGGRVFDGTGAPARGATVIIERNRIAAVVPAGSTEAPAAIGNARVIDVSGKTVMPGLIDLHTHLTYADSTFSSDAREAEELGPAMLRAEERLRYFAAAGITTVRDVSSIGTLSLRLKTRVQQNRIAGPRIFAAGQLITAPGGHGTSPYTRAPCRDQPETAVCEASGPEEWREAVRLQFKRGADLIKLASHFSQEEVRAAVEEAHALGLKVTVDAETFYIRRAVDAGVDCVEHPLPRTDETILRMAKQGVDSVPTLVPYIYIFDGNGGYFGSSSRRFTFSKEANLELFRKMKRAGIRMGVGTDLIYSNFRRLPQAYITELEQFVAGGYRVPEALVAATLTSAQILDMDDKLGTLQPGKLADVLVVAGRPDVDLTDLAKVSLVIRDGYTIVENGRIVVPDLEHQPEPKPR